MARRIERRLLVEELENRVAPSALGADLDADFVPLAGDASSCSVQGSGAAEYTTNFLADFEDGDDGFLVNNYSDGLWHRSEGHGAEEGHSLGWSFYFGQGEDKDGGGTYDTGLLAAGTLVSPEIALPDAGLIYASFNYLLETEPYTPARFDIAKLQINDGGAWTDLARYDDVADSSIWTSAPPVNLSAYAGRTVELRFVFDTVDGRYNWFEGWYVDDVHVYSASPDEYTFSLAAGETASIGVTCADGSPAVALALYDGCGAQVAEGLAVDANLSEVIQGYGALWSDTYTICVTAAPGAEYTLDVVKNGLIEVENNDTQAAAQDMTGAGGVLASLGDEDYYAYELAAGQTLTLGTATPDSEADPGIALCKSDGTVVATGSVLADGRNESLTYTASETGIYYMKVKPDGEAVEGAYFLQADRTANPVVLGAGRCFYSFTDADGDVVSIYFLGAGTATIGDRYGNAPQGTNIEEFKLENTSTGTMLLAGRSGLGGANTLSLGTVYGDGSLGFVQLLAWGGKVTDTTMGLGGNMYMLFSIGSASNLDVHLGGNLSLGLVYGNATNCDISANGMMLMQVLGDAQHNEITVQNDLSQVLVSGIVYDTTVEAGGRIGFFQSGRDITDCRIEAGDIGCLYTRSINGTAVIGAHSLGTIYSQYNLSNSRITSGGNAGSISVYGNTNTPLPGDVAVNIKGNLGRISTSIGVQNARLNVGGNLGSASFSTYLAYATVDVGGNVGSLAVNGAIRRGSTVHIGGDVSSFRVSSGIRENSLVEIDGALGMGQLNGLFNRGAIEAGSTLRVNALKSMLLANGGIAGTVEITGATKTGIVQVIGNLSGSLTGAVLGDVMVIGRFSGVIDTPSGRMLQVTQRGGGGTLTTPGAFQTVIGYP